MKIFSPLFLATILFATTAQADRLTFGISESLDKNIQEGLHELYNFNFKKANSIFTSIKDQAEAHPMVHFGLASSEWWRVSAMVLEPDAEESAPFLTAVNLCINDAEKKIEKGDPTGEAHLVLGGALGLLGRWEATNGQWVSAYFRGKKAIKYLEKALKINPELHDAKMGLGMFDYIVATLPAVVRNLAFIGKGSDPQVGIQELHEAAEKGTYARTPSKLFLCQIYTQMEKKPELALGLLSDLREEYPKSPFIHMMQIISIYNAHQLEDLKKESDDFMMKFSSGVYSEEFVNQGHFAQAAYAYINKDWQTALDQFELAATTGYVKDPWRTWARLYSGYCYDALGKREEAKKAYQTVLQLQRRWGSHDAAKARLKRPFKGTDDEIKTLDL